MPRDAKEGRLRVGVLFGGRSVEHGISIQTALQAAQALDSSKYAATLVYLDLAGRWYAGEGLARLDWRDPQPRALPGVEEVALHPVPGAGGLFPAGSSGRGWLRKAPGVIPVDVWLVAFHGSYGEDGCIQGLLEIADVPYTGSGVLASSLSMNKAASKRVVASREVPVLPDRLVQRSELAIPPRELRARILSTPGLERFPLFIKPNHLGSSVGVSAAADEAALDAALELAFRFDDEVLVEPQVRNMREINVSVVEGAPPRASVTEIPIRSGTFLSFDDKYLHGGAKKTGGDEGMAGQARRIDPAEISAETKALAQRHARSAFEALGCAGVVRVDLIEDLDTGKLWFNEINPIPGSLSFYLWGKSDPALPLTELLDRILQGALRRHQQKATLQRELNLARK